MDNELTNRRGEGFSLPAEFARRMADMLGEEYPAFLASYDKPAHPSLRVNTLRMGVEEALGLCPFGLSPVPWTENGFYYDGDTRPGKHPLHEAGLYYIQEASAMLPAALCPPLPGERVLDLCAAPGGKASQLAASLCGEGLLVANEIHPARAAVLSQNLERMGVRNALVVNATPAELAERFPSFFDKIVVDAPCSGEGMFRKEPDALSMWSPDNVALCANRQREILESAVRMLKAGGYLVYSTCTFAPEENEGALLELLTRHPEMEVVSSASPAVEEAVRLGLLDRGNAAWLAESEAIPPSLREQAEKALRVFPHHCDGEGHFAVLLRKADGVETPVSLREGGKKSRKGQKSSAKGKASLETAAEAAAVKLFEDFCREVMGGVPAFAGETVPCLFGEKLYLLPAALGLEPKTALEGLRVLRAGLCVGSVVGLERGRGRFEPDHALALAAGLPLRSFEVDMEGALSYLRGETLPCSLRGWYAVTFRGLSLGWGKASDGVMKNHYPKGLRW